jgi:hypothetical protein
MDSTELATITCENCQANNGTPQKFCSTCSFPIGGTEEEKAKFRTKIAGHTYLMQEAAKETKTARIIIHVLAGFVLLQGLFLWFTLEDFVGLIANSFICLVFIILAAWCQRNPFGAILTAFMVYITINVVNAFFDPATLLQGLFMKLFFIGAFVKGIRSAREAQEHLAELARLKAAPIGSD